MSCTRRTHLKILISSSTSWKMLNSAMRSATGAATRLREGAQCPFVGTDGCSQSCYPGSRERQQLPLVVPHLRTVSHQLVSRSMAPKAVLMVCLGNICRSPIAEAVFRSEIEKRALGEEWVVDSAATSAFHTGSLADGRARQVLASHCLPAEHRARTLDSSDFSRFHFIFGMDETNVSDIKSVAPKDSTADILMLGAFDPEDQSGIRDPYYDSGSKGFDQCFRRCERAVRAFLDQQHVY